LFSGFPWAPAAAQQKGGVPSTAKLTRQGNTYVVTIPGVAWTLQFPADDLELIISRVQMGYSYFGLSHRSLAKLAKMTERGEKPSRGELSIV
jgi:hypothetical protein